MTNSKHAEAAEIGLRLSHSEGTLDFIKKHNYALYTILEKLDSERLIGFDDFMILEYQGDGKSYYSCPICKDCRMYASSFGYARKHYEIHIPEIHEILSRGYSSRQ